MKNIVLFYTKEDKIGKGSGFAIFYETQESFLIALDENGY